MLRAETIVLAQVLTVETEAHVIADISWRDPSLSDSVSTLAPMADEGDNGKPDLDAYSSLRSHQPCITTQSYGLGNRG